MKYVDEYRDAARVAELAGQIASRVTRPWTLMEVCGGQTHSILRFGLDQLLPTGVELSHGPGCPVCVTSTEAIDRAIALAGLPEVVLCTYADMLRVPGSRTDLYAARADGADVRAIYSPLEAVQIATRSPGREVVLFAVGFETTAPAHALAVLQARAARLPNFSLLASHVLVPPAIEALVSASDNRVQGFLAAGHVCAVMGTEAYEPLCRKYHVPVVVTGFEPVDILQGILQLVTQLEEGRAVVENAYARVVRAEGNPVAVQQVAEVFEVVERHWRGLGPIAESGLGLRPEFARFDAQRRFGCGSAPMREGPGQDARCIAGDVLRGVKRPPSCAAFGSACTPLSPLGAPMVSSEGACAAYFRYRRRAAPESSSGAP
ncbi:MAG: hydrogenase formation protein HypD [Myxococcales bacterium]|nr:hydrogenase formation protein HypD [Myxococcales bacterium]MDD9967366.1 hydrogenase formation protein HypD [Myxococcales bacterium]